MRGRPLKHGPHWPADSSARYRATRAVSARPHRSGGQRGHHPGPDRRPERAQRRVGQRQPRRLRRGQPRAVVARRRARPAPGRRRRSARRLRRRPGRLAGAGGQPEQVRQAGRRAAPRSTLLRPSARCSVASMLPGSAAGARARNQAAPYRAISARWARVSTFCTSDRPGPDPAAAARAPAGRRAAPAGPPGGWPARTPHRPGTGPAPAASSTVAASMPSGGPFRDRRRQPGVQPLGAPHVEHGGRGNRPPRRRPGARPAPGAGRSTAARLSLLLAGSPSAPLPATSAAGAWPAPPRRACGRRGRRRRPGRSARRPPPRRSSAGAARAESAP